jgi:Glycosyltransferase family 87
MGTLGLRERFRQMSQTLSALPESLQLLIALALSCYVAWGLFLGLFSNGFDFAAFHQAAARVASGHGAAIYQEYFTVDPVRHPVMFGYTAPVALLYAPFGIIPLRWAWPLFQIVSHVCLWAAWWLTVLEARERGVVRPETQMGIGIALFFPIYCSLWIGQCEAELLLLILATVRFCRRGNWLTAGLLLSVAICLKFFLVFLLVYFLFAKRWRLLLSCVGGLIILEAASLRWIPWNVQISFWRQLSSWSARIDPFYDNQAVSGFFSRLLTVNDYTLGIAHLPRLAQGLQWVTSSAIVLGYVFCLRRRLSFDDFEWAFSFTLVTALLISPLTDTHHLALLLIPFLFFTFSPGARPGWRWFYAFFAVFTPFVVFKFDDLDRLLYFATGFHELVFSLPFFVLTALWIYMARQGVTDEAV